MGRPLPGFQISLVDPQDKERPEGEVAVKLDPRPTGLMTGYMDDPELTRVVMQNGLYHTGDQAALDEDGYLFFVGRADDVFKSSDYRISPFQLESVLMEHPLVAEVAIVPSPDPLRTNVPKAFIAIVADARPSKRLPARSCCSRSRSWLRMSGCGSSNSMNCPRRSRERYAGPSCAR
jgi:acetyl-CoA synthetase